MNWDITYDLMKWMDQKKHAPFVKNLSQLSAGLCVIGSKFRGTT